MRSCAILSSSSGSLTSCTVVFIAGTPVPATALRVELAFCVMSGARNLSLRRVFRCRSKRQSVMERFAKAKFDAVSLLRCSRAKLESYLIRYPGIVYLGDKFSPELERSGAYRNNVRLCAAATLQGFR